MKRQSKKYLSRTFIVLVLSLVIALGMSIISFAAEGEWKKDSNGWWFKQKDGSYPKSAWVEIDKKWYYFDNTGYMVSNEYREGYWVGADGAWVPTYKGGKWASNSVGKWYTDSSGWYPVKSWLKIDGKWYYFDDKGYLATKQWIDDYYVDESGAWVPDAKRTDYSGTYVEKVAGRGVITVTKFSSDSKYYKISVKWADSASVSYEWYLTGEFDANGELKYKDCSKTKVEYDSTGGSVSTSVYAEGTGTIKIKDGVLTWVDDKENVAKDAEFPKQAEVKVTGKDYSGNYYETIAGRARVEIKAAANNFFNVTVTWPDSAAKSYEWTFSGTFDKDGVMKYTDCTKNELTADEDGKLISTVVYKNGTGSIKINDKNELTWSNNNEDIAKDTVFKLDN